MNPLVVLPLISLIGFSCYCITGLSETRSQKNQTVHIFNNAYEIAEDIGERVYPTYFFKRAWVQLTRDLSRTEVPPTLPLDLDELSLEPFAVAWLGHATQLVRAGKLWILIDPALSKTAGPVQSFGPERLTPLPFERKALPRIDVVLVSHDHYDHLDLNTVRALAQQKGGAPKFLVGRGLEEWFSEHVSTNVIEFDWWDRISVDDTEFHFVPAQHNSGRTPLTKNKHLWGGWVISHAGSKFYFTGDTAFVEKLFEDIRDKAGPIDVAALPIGAYQPRRLMRYEHMDPSDALNAHRLLKAQQSFGVHWGTFQLGDEEPFDAAIDLAAAMKHQSFSGVFGLIPIGGFVKIGSTPDVSIVRPEKLLPTYAMKH